MYKISSNYFQQHSCRTQNLGHMLERTGAKAGKTTWIGCQSFSEHHSHTHAHTYLHLKVSCLSAIDGFLEGVWKNNENQEETYTDTERTQGS